MENILDVMLFVFSETADKLYYYFIYLIKRYKTGIKEDGKSNA